MALLALGRPTLRSYRLGRRRHSVPIPSVQFPALANFGPAESTGTDDSASVPVLRQRSPLTGFLTASEEQLFPLSVSSDTDQPLNVGGRLKRWLRDAVWPDLLGYNPTICGGVLEDFSAAEYHGGTLRTEELAPRPQTSSYGGCTRDDVNRADDANRASTEAFETPLLDDIYCRRSDASEDGTDETEVVEGNWADLDESRPQRLEWQPSHHHQRDERRRSGLADWELSHVNNSGLSEDTAYLALPENKCPSEEVLGACSFDQHQQNAWCAAAAAVAPCFVSPVEPLRAPPSFAGRVRAAAEGLQAAGGCRLLRDPAGTQCSQAAHTEKLRGQMAKARVARARMRFAVPVILYDGKNICRSATLSGGLEIYGRTIIKFLGCMLTGRLESSEVDVTHSLCGWKIPC
ncbi:uncharacterized protein LOC144127929 [Amblyomma americanum]